jgi:fluoride exporter
MRYLFVVGAGGALGSISRYLLAQFIQGKTVSQFPYGTLTVNLIGCFFIGMIYAISTRKRIERGGPFVLCNGIMRRLYDLLGVFKRNSRHAP